MHPWSNERERRQKEGSTAYLAKCLLNVTWTEICDWCSTWSRFTPFEGPVVRVERVGTVLVQANHHLMLGATIHWTQWTEQNTVDVTLDVGRCELRFSEKAAFVLPLGYLLGC